MSGELPLNCDRDAARWAREFVEKWRGCEVGKHQVDEALMIAWFANAMMCGEDTYRWKQEKAAPSVVRNEALVKRLSVEPVVRPDARSTTRYEPYVTISEAMRDEIVHSLQSSPAEGVFVPVEPPIEMVLTAYEEVVDGLQQFRNGNWSETTLIVAIYKAMLSARPEVEDER